jgi:hypothetical protein
MDDVPVEEGQQVHDADERQHAQIDLAQQPRVIDAAHGRGEVARARGLGIRVRRASLFGHGRRRGHGGRRVRPAVRLEEGGCGLRGMNVRARRIYRREQCSRLPRARASGAPAVTRSQDAGPAPFRADVPQTAKAAAWTSTRPAVGGLHGGFTWV